MSHPQHSPNVPNVPNLTNQPPTATNRSIEHITDVPNVPSPIDPIDNSPKLADAVFEGGGVRGLGHVGALVEAERRGYQWANIAGTSAGAIVASMLAAGYTASELYDIMQTVDYRRFADNDSLNWFFPRKLFNIVVRGGLHPGNYIEDFVREKLQARGKTKFGDLHVPGQEDNPLFRYRLTVIVSDISSGRMVRLPQDAHTCYGLDPDELDIARAVRMSASIPFFFIPVRQQCPDGRTCCIVDGGLLSNFPIALFDVHDREPLRPTFGFRLVDQPREDITTTLPALTPTSNSYQILQALLHTVLTAHDRLYMDDHTYVRTIAIPTHGISSTAFNLSKKEADQLYHSGEETAKKFFATWDFEAYKAAYRQGCTLPGRLERLHTEMRSITQTTPPASL